MKLLTISLLLSLPSTLLADQQSLEDRIIKLEERISALEKHLTTSKRTADQHPIIGKWTQEGNGHTMDFRPDKTLVLAAGTFTILGTYEILEDGNIQLNIKGEDKPTVMKAVFEGSLVTLSDLDSSNSKVFIKST